MKKLGTVILLVVIAITASADPGEAGWRKRGWYMKKPSATCAMRRITARAAGGVLRFQAVRVCGY